MVQISPGKYSSWLKPGRPKISVQCCSNRMPLQMGGSVTASVWAADNPSRAVTDNITDGESHHQRSKRWWENHIQFLARLIEKIYPSMATISEFWMHLFIELCSNCISIVDYYLFSLWGSNCVKHIKRKQWICESLKGAYKLWP